MATLTPLDPPDGASVCVFVRTCVLTVEIDGDVDDTAVLIVSDDRPSVSPVVYTRSPYRRRTGTVAPVYTPATRNASAHCTAYFGAGNKERCSYAISPMAVNGF